MKYLDYKGCGNCKLNGACKDFQRSVNIRFNKSERADNCGKIVTVFRKGEIVEGKAVIKDDKVYCASAKSNIYKGYYDFVGLNNITIELLRQ